MIVSSAVSGKPWRCRRRAKTVTFCHISTITEHITLYSKYLFSIKGEICTNKGNKSKFSLARIMPLFGLRIFIQMWPEAIHLRLKKAATAERWCLHAVLLLLFITTTQANLVVKRPRNKNAMNNVYCVINDDVNPQKIY